MELSRIRRMVRARWWLILLMSLLGLVVAVAVTRYQNDQIESRWSAVATVEFITEGPADEEEATGGRDGSGEGADDPAAPLAEAAADASLEINAALLENPNVEQKTDPTLGTLNFVALSPSAETAAAIVIEMRDAYVAVDPTAVDVGAEILVLVERNAVIRNRLAELEPPPEPEVEEIPVAIQAEIDVLNGRIGTVSGKVGLIQDELNTALDAEDEAEIERLEGELDKITVQLTGLKRDLKKITPPEPEILDFDLAPEEELEKSALENEVAAIGVLYQELLAAGESTDSIVLPEIVVTDATPGPTSPTLAALIGLLGGALAGLGAIIALDRVQGTVWTASDMAEMPILAEVPQQASRVQLSSRRYAQVRQTGVQSVRSAILGLFHASGPVTIGFTGLGTDDQSVSELVLEAAHSLAGVGRSVLLVDGQVGGMSAYRDRFAGGSTLSDLVAHSADEAALSSSVAGILDDTTKLGDNLSVLPGDPRRVDAVDTLASKSFRELTEQAIARYDIVLVVGPSALSPFAYVMAGLVSSYIVVATIGRTRQAHIDELAKQFAGSRSRLIGAVLLGIRPRRGFVQSSSMQRTPAAVTASTQVDGSEMASGGAEPMPEGEGGLLDRLGQSLGALAGDKNEK